MLRLGDRRRSWLWPGLLVAAIVGSSATATAASGAGVYWTRVSLLKSFFARSEKVSWKRIDVATAAKKSLHKRLGKTPPARLTAYYGLRAGKVQGIAVIDDQIGQHEPITFAVLIGPDGKLKRLEVVAYREAHGGEIRGLRFRKQFAGKGPADKLRLGYDIAAISGATISSKAMVVGARRSLIMVHELIIKPGVERVLRVGGTAKR